MAGHHDAAGYPSFSSEAEGMAALEGQVMRALKGGASLREYCHSNLLNAPPAERRRWLEFMVQRTTVPADFRLPESARVAQVA